MNKDIHDNDNNYLKPLIPLPVSQQDQVGKQKQAELRKDQVLSVPVSQPGLGYVGALPLTKSVVPEYTKSISSIPLHEKTDEEKKVELNIKYLEDANGLDYPIIKESNIVDICRYERYNDSNKTFQISANFEPRTYKSQLRINQNQYIDGRASYLKFKLKLTNDNDNVNFASGSATNIIKSCYIDLPNGERLDTYEKFDLYNHVNDRIIKSADYYIGNYDSYAYLKGHRESGVALLEEDEYVIFLPDIAKIFNSTSLLPPSLLNNMTITFEFNNPDHAFKRINPVAAPANGALFCRVDNFKWHLKSYTLDNEFLKKIDNKQIIIEYPTYETYMRTETNHQFNFDLSVSKSRVLSVFCRPHDSDIPESDIDNLTIESSTEYTNLINTKWFVGDIQQPSYTLDSNQDWYIKILDILRRTHDQTRVQLGLTEFKTTDYITGVDLKRSLYNNDGTPIDYSNLIRFETEVLNDNLKRYTFNFIVMYMKRVIIEQDASLDPNNRYPKFKILE